MNSDSLYRLLPALYRLRDADEGEPLKALIALFEEELGALEENLEQLYDDQFIETCAEWAVPYIGGLVGYRPLTGDAPRVSSPRADVANTIRNRRRKGTASMLATLARDVTGWPARVVEFFEQLATTQYMNHTRPHAIATAAIDSQRRLQGIGGAFNAVAHTAEVRRPETGTGRYNIPNIGIYLWRLQPFRLTGVPLVADPDDASGRRFRLNPLGANTALFRHPIEADEVPAPLAIRDFALQVRIAVAGAGTDAVAMSGDYGADRSIVLTHAGATLPLRAAGAAAPDDPDSRCVVRIADLADVFDSGGNFAGWAHENDIAAEQIGLDPERGRILLGTTRAAEHAVEPIHATFHSGFSRPIGGGEYERTPEPVDAAIDVEASAGEDLQPHLDALAPSGGRLLIADSLTYAQPAPVFAVGAPDASGRARTLVVGARNGVRPLLTAGSDVLVDIGPHGRLVIDGLVIAGGALRLPAAADNAPRTLVLRDCTLVPGRTLATNGDAAQTNVPSIVVAHPFTQLLLERCITGPLHVVAGAGVKLADCIVDAANDAIAFAADADGAVGAELEVRECTMLGDVRTRLMRLASNSIFGGTVHAARRQEGCIRYCWLPAASIAPRRFRCQPDAQHPDVRPHFTSPRYADPGYCQLARITSPRIREGASDGGEMGVMHALFQPQRETNLRIRLDEYLRFGLHAGLFYAT